MVEITLSYAPVGLHCSPNGHTAGIAATQKGPGDIGLRSLHVCCLHAQHLDTATKNFTLLMPVGLKINRDDESACVSN